MNVLQRSVLVLNRNWLPINSVSVQTAISQMASGAVTALDIRGENHLVPVRWEQWLELDALNEEEVIHTANKAVRQPTVIVCCEFDKLHRRKAKFTMNNVARRDGYKCAYTGKKLDRDRWSLDHVIPRSRGGSNTPDNVVLADKDINNRKGSLTPKEAGLPDPVIKRMPDFEMPAATHPHHELFLA